MHGCSDLSAFLDVDHMMPIESSILSNVYRVRLKNGTILAIKSMRASPLLPEDDGVMVMRTASFGSGPGSNLCGLPIQYAARRVLGWSQVRHNNVQELLGILYFQGGPGLVSPWMEHRNLQGYIASYPGVERHELVCSMLLPAFGLF